LQSNPRSNNTLGLLASQANRKVLLALASNNSFLKGLVSVGDQPLGFRATQEATVLFLRLNPPKTSPNPKKREGVLQNRGVLRAQNLKKAFGQATYPNINLGFA